MVTTKPMGLKFFRLAAPQVDLHKSKLELFFCGAASRGKKEKLTKSPLVQSWPCGARQLGFAAARS
jgi:hypothetical protein